MVLLATAALGLTFAGGALGATPQQIYQDLADNGKLDKQYSKADLQRALRNPSIAGYNGAKQPSGGQLQQEITRKRGAPLAAARVRGGLPFTGLDLALLVLGGGALLVVGFGTRRLARARR